MVHGTCLQLFSYFLATSKVNHYLKPASSFSVQVLHYTLHCSTTINKQRNAIHLRKNNRKFWVPAFKRFAFILNSRFIQNWLKQRITRSVQGSLKTITSSQSHDLIDDRCNRSKFIYYLLHLYCSVHEYIYFKWFKLI